MRKTAYKMICLFVGVFVFVSGMYPVYACTPETDDSVSLILLTDADIQDAQIITAEIPGQIIRIQCQRRVNIGFSDYTYHNVFLLFYKKSLTCSDDTIATYYVRNRLITKYIHKSDGKKKNLNLY